MNIYETCVSGENGESSEDDSSSEDKGDEAELPQQSSVMEIVRQRVRTVHGSDFGDSNELHTSDSFLEKMPKKTCKLPLRFAVTALIIISILASSCSMFMFLMLQWSRAHQETLKLFRAPQTLCVAFVFFVLHIFVFRSSSCQVVTNVVHASIRPTEGSLHDQGKMLQEQLIETSRSAAERLLLNIEWSVWWYIVQPPSQATLFLFSFLKTIPMDLGTLA